MTQKHEDSMAQDHDTSHRSSLLKHARLPIQRASGLTEHPDIVNRAIKRLRPHLLAAMIVLSITVVGLYAFGGFVLLKTGLGGPSLPSPLAYLLIGLFLVFAVLKLKHVVGFMYRKENRERPEEDGNG